VFLRLDILTEISDEGASSRVVMTDLSHRHFCPHIFVPNIKASLSTLYDMFR
jgi:hypothetical protein